MQIQRWRYTNSKETARHLLTPIVSERREECAAEIVIDNLRVEKVEVQSSTWVQSMACGNTPKWISDLWYGLILILNAEMWSQALGVETVAGFGTSSKHALIEQTRLQNYPSHCVNYNPTHRKSIFHLLLLIFPFIGQKIYIVGK